MLTVQFPASLQKHTLCISPHSLPLGEVSQGGRNVCDSATEIPYWEVTGSNLGQTNTQGR